jgi:hypothetical protein
MLTNTSPNLHPCTFYRHIRAPFLTGSLWGILCQILTAPTPGALKCWHVIPTGAFYSRPTEEKTMIFSNPLGDFIPVLHISHLEGLLSVGMYSRRENSRINTFICMKKITVMLRRIIADFSLGLCIFCKKPSSGFRNFFSPVEYP